MKPEFALLLSLGLLCTAALAFDFGTSPHGLSANLRQVFCNALPDLLPLSCQAAFDFGGVR